MFKNIMKMLITPDIVVIYFIVILAMLALVSSWYLGDDAVIEEAVEDIIEKKTGIDIDLTPGSKEADKLIIIDLFGDS